MQGRTVIVGDVHGCYREVAELLERVGLGSGDRLFFVGDLIARGPASRDVLRLARELGARSVRGNHEQRLLEARRRALSGRRPRLSSPHYHVYKTLEEPDWAWLDSLPLTIQLPEHGLCIVHGGVVPGLPVERQPPEALLWMRGIDEAGAPSRSWDCEPWARHYSGEPHVVFGHNSRAGLQLYPCATGLDTGCVYGHSLSALVLGPGQGVPEPPTRLEVIHSVAAERCYYRGRPGSG